MYIGGNTGCTSCTQKAEELKKQQVIESDWLTREQVKELCEPCYNNMVIKNISRIRRSHFLEKFTGNKMKFYEITFKGSEGDKVNLAGHTIEANSIKYFSVDELPVQESVLNSIPNLSFNIIERDVKPTDIESKIKAKALEGQKGIKWIGPSPLRHNEFGRFPRNEVVFVDDNVAVKLISLGGFQLA